MDGTELYYYLKPVKTINYVFNLTKKKPDYGKNNVINKIKNMWKTLNSVVVGCPLIVYKND